jgi:dipeptidyl aminopeptidase/acylaminoacyl peptidase
VDRADTRQDVWVLPLQPKGEPIPIARTNANESRPRFSPDGRWIAYESDESGRNEVYVQPIPPTGGKSQVSTKGGTFPIWRGRELFFVDDQNTVVAVPVAASGTTVSFGPPSSLFSMQRAMGFSGMTYDVTEDGRTFLVRTLLDPPRQPIWVMLNWPARLGNSR